MGAYAIVSVRKISALQRRASARSRAPSIGSRQEHGVRVAFLPLGGVADAEVSTDVIRLCKSAPVLLPECSLANARPRSFAARASSSGCACTR